MHIVAFSRTLVYVKEIAVRLRTPFLCLYIRHILGFADRLFQEFHIEGFGDIDAVVTLQSIYNPVDVGIMPKPIGAKAFTLYSQLFFT